MTGRLFWVAAWLYAIGWVLAVTVFLPVWFGQPPLIVLTWSPVGWLALMPLVIGLLVAAVRRYDEGRPASRALDELQVRRATRPSPAPIDVEVGRRR